MAMPSTQQSAPTRADEFGVYANYEMPPPPPSVQTSQQQQQPSNSPPSSSPPPSFSSPPMSPQMQYSQPQYMPPESHRDSFNIDSTSSGIGMSKGFGLETGINYNQDGGGSRSRETGGYSPSINTDDDSFAFKSPDPFYYKVTKYINTRYQLLLDASTPHWALRWTFSLVILLIFMIRIVVAQGWYVICYGLSIYYLNLFIGFLSPRIDPAFAAGGEFDIDDLNDSATGPMLPTKANDEFKPFIRRLPEFQFWLSATTATLISLFLTLFEIFDLPVFWPILLLYFILLFVSTMRQQIRHMVKYGYVPWDKGKKKYGQSNQEPSSLFSTTI